MYPDRCRERAARHARDYILGQMRTLAWPLRFLVSVLPTSLKTAIAEAVRRHYLRKEAVKCRLCRLSDFLREQGVDRIDLLKIDAEYSEHEILAGLSEEDWPKVRQLVVEVHDGEDATAALGDSLRPGLPRRGRDQPSNRRPLPGLRRAPEDSDSMNPSRANHELIAS